MLSSELTHFYCTETAAHTLLDEAYVAGCIFAVSASPEIPMPEVWMSWTLQPNAHSINKTTADNLADALMGQLRWQLDRMRKNQSLLPVDCQWHSEKQARRTLERWLRGALFAHQQCEAVWQAAWEKADVEEGEARLIRCLKCFSILADSDAAVLASKAEKRAELADNLPVLSRQLEQLLQDYVKLAGELACTLPGQFEVSKQRP